MVVIENTRDTTRLNTQPSNHAKIGAVHIYRVSIDIMSKYDTQQD